MGERPEANDETYPTTLVGNFFIDTASSSNFSVSSNDSGDQISLALDTINNGTVTLNSNGTFAYNPNPGFEGNDTFSYSVSNGFGSATGTATLSVSGMVWFIDNSAGCGGDGRIGSPFNTLAAFEAINGNGGAGHPAAGDNIFLYAAGGGDYTGGVTLENNQRLIGQAGELIAQHIVSAPCEQQLWDSLRKLVQMPATTGNRVDLLIDGQQTFDSIVAGMEAARHYILFQFYIIRDDELGRRLFRVLEDKARAGLKVFLLYDEMCSPSFPHPSP